MALNDYLCGRLSAESAQSFDGTGQLFVRQEFRFGNLVRNGGRRLVQRELILQSPREYRNSQSKEEESPGPTELTVFQRELHSAS